MKMAITGHVGSGCVALAAYLSRLYPEHSFQACSFTENGNGEAFDACDDVLLVVNLMDGPMPGTRQAIQAAHKSKARLVGFALTHLDTFDAQSQHGPHIKELVGLESRELASCYGYKDDAIPMAQLALVPGCEQKLRMFFEAVETYASQRTTPTAV